jgi:hypothetical protein
MYDFSLTLYIHSISQDQIIVWSSSDFEVYLPPWSVRIGGFFIGTRRERHRGMEWGSNRSLPSGKPRIRRLWGIGVGTHVGAISIVQSH